MQKISQSIAIACEKCAHMENTIHESNSVAEGMLETICSNIDTVANQCIITIKSDVQIAMGGAMISVVMVIIMMM